MRGCGYATLAQCKAAVSGVFGSCDRNPFYSNANASAAKPKTR